MKTTQEVSERTGATHRTAQRWASENGVAYIGEGMRKTYQWSASDIERFLQRPKPGRRWHKDKEPQGDKNK